MAEVPGGGLGQAGVEGVQHAGQFQGRSAGQALRSVTVTAVMAAPGRGEDAAGWPAVTVGGDPAAGRRRCLPAAAASW